MKYEVKKYYEESCNPARFEIYKDGTAIIWINDFLKDEYNDCQWEFWVNHELAHIKLNTINELICDNFAIQSLFCKYKNSLKDCVEAVLSLDIPEVRKNNIVIAALTLDARAGNKEAEKELRNFKKFSKMRRGRADGDEENVVDDVVDDVPTNRVRRKQRGISINDYTISFEAIGILLFCVVYWFKK